MWWKILPQELVKTKRLNSDACLILTYFGPEIPIQSGRIERELRKLKGIKEITINHLTHTVKIRYDPKVITEEKMRSIIKRLASHLEV